MWAIKQTFQILAPYLAVGIFWCGTGNAWLAILAYHAQIVFWAWLRAGERKHYNFQISDSKFQKEAVWKHPLLFALPTLAAGPLLWVLLPHITRTDLSAWLTSHHLSRQSLALLIPYFGLLHPILEQIHWAPLRERTPLAHPLFAGYHLLVLGSLLTLPWLVASFAVLTTASFAWEWMRRKAGGSLLVPAISHLLADLGIVVAAFVRG